MSVVAVRYSIATGRVRSWVVYDGPTDSGKNGAAVTPGKGEALAVFPIDSFNSAKDRRDINVIQAAINGVTHLDPDAAKADAFALTDNTGLVVATVFLDMNAGDKAPAGLTAVAVTDPLAVIGAIINPLTGTVLTPAPNTPKIVPLDEPIV